MVRPRVVFVNSGILGMQSFSKYIREVMATDPDIASRHINLSEDLTVDERVVRRLLCMRFWPDGLFGLNNVDLARLRQDYHAGLQAVRRIRRAEREDGIDVLHFHRQATAYGSLRTLRRVPSVISIDATQDVVIDNASSAIERWSYAPNAAIDGRIISRAFAVVSTSQWAADCLRRRYPDCSTPVHVMPAPVRIQFFGERWIEERAARATAGYLPRVLFVGGDFVRKGGEDLIAAWREAELHRVATLDLVTDWPQLPLDVPGVNVIRGVASYTAYWCELWQMADVFVLPSRDEAFGNVFQEAAAAGLPRIGTRLNAIPEMIVDGESGILVPLRDRAALVHALRALVESASLRRAYGSAARSAILCTASLAAYHQRLRAILLDAADSTNRSAPRR